MLEGQTNIFEMLYPTYKITKKIRTIELFAGYGSTKLAWNYLGIDVESYKICEWAVKSIQAYKDIHFTDDNTDYSKDLSVEEIKQYLFNKGISSNYNEPMTQQQVNRLNEKQARTIYNNIKTTHNLVNIQQVKGKDLEIVDKDKYEYVLSYSFPCQDLSLAGKGKGMSDRSTRSGMLWEVERILQECKELGTLPQILLMENVPQVHGADNVEDFNKWQLRLEELGYHNYFQDLIATDYGIPQTRNRCFMVSILGDYNYTFPKPIPLKLKLKDMLEESVDEKYYLSDKMISYFTKHEQDMKEKGNGFRFNVSDGNCIGKTITTNAGSRMDDNFITNKSLKETLEQNEIDDTCYIDTYNRKINKEKSGTITTGVSFRNNTFLAIKNATKKGYLEATDGDGVDISSRMEYHRGTVQKDKAQTLTTQCDRGVVINYHYGIATNESKEWQKEPLEEKSRTILANKSNGGVGLIDTNLRIRKLSPRECWRLMGVKDEDFDKVAKNQSDSSLYHLAGDSIVVNVLCYLYKQLI